MSSFENVEIFEDTKICVKKMGELRTLLLSP